MNNLLSDISKQVSAALSAAADRPLHQLKPGDWVLVRNFRRKQLKSRQWQGPFQILLTTHAAVKVAERAMWVHATHCKKVAEPAAAEDVGSRMQLRTTFPELPLRTTRATKEHTHDPEFSFPAIDVDPAQHRV